MVIDLKESNHSDIPHNVSLVNTMPRSPRSRIGTLQRSWDDYYEPQVGISADSARYVRHRAARSFTECLARMFPLVEFRGRSLPIQNEAQRMASASPPLVFSCARPELVTSTYLPGAASDSSHYDCAHRVGLKVAT